MAMLLPQLISIKTPPINSVMKNILINGIKECIFRGVDGTTDFIDIASLS